DSLLWLRAQFKRLTVVPKWVHPAIGGMAVGCLAVGTLALFHLNGIAGDPYKTLTLALTGSMGVLPVMAMAVFCVAALLAQDGIYLDPRHRPPNLPRAKPLLPPELHGEASF